MTTYQKLTEQLANFGENIAKEGQACDQQDQLSQENYKFLKEINLFSAMVPTQLGGQGVSYSQMCHLLEQLASYHPSTALSVSMHQHIVAANCFNYRHGKPGQALLEKVLAKELVLISTGAGDWLASNGELKATEGGYLLSATKHFASGSPVGDVLVTSAPFEDPELGWQVFHFPVAKNANGVTVLDNWHPMGMRGTGSNSVALDEVFIAEETIALKRPRGDFHAIWSVVLPVALPLIMSVYLGIAKAAANKAKQLCQTSKDPVTPYILGEMENALTTAKVLHQDMVNNVGQFDFTPDLNTVNEMVKRKTIVANACKEAVNKAVEVCGGPGYLRQFGIESLLRDVMASHFHPLQEKRQYLFTGSLAMGKEPPSQAF